MGNIINDTEAAIWGGQRARNHWQALEYYHSSIKHESKNTAYFNILRQWNRRVPSQCYNRRSSYRRICNNKPRTIRFKQKYCTWRRQRRRVVPPTIPPSAGTWVVLCHQPLQFTITMHRNFRGVSSSKLAYYYCTQSRTSSSCNIHPHATINRRQVGVCNNIILTTTTTKFEQLSGLGIQ